MNHFHEPMNPASSDPLERLIEAFVEQSVPEGPDVATQRRLIAALSASSSAANSSHVVRSITLRPAEPPKSRVRRWTRTAVQQTIGIAAAIAAVVAGAVYLTPGPNDGPTGVQGAVNDQIAQAPLAGDNGTQLENAAGPEFARLLENYFRTHEGQRVDRRAFNAVFADYLKDHPDLAKSKSWQFAQARLHEALEQPEVIGLGVGLLGTLPWTTYGRF